jgi:hypothetical protein
MLIVALGGVRLQVPLSRLDEAKRLLEENVALEAETDICPRCGGLDSVMDDSPSWKASLLAAHLVGVPLPWKGKRHRCRDCGHEWNDGGP